MAEIPMPRLSDSMEEGMVVRWLKSDGDQVEVGEHLVEIETDKANMVYEADAAGVLEILLAEGQAAAVGTAIARLSNGGPERPAPDGPGSNRPSASPLARRAADALSVDLASVMGTGPRGRIVKADVVAAAPTPAPAVPAAPTPALAAAKGKVEIATPSRVQETVARRMAESMATAPDFTVSVDVDMGDLVSLREQIKRAVELAPTVNDLIVRAAAVCLRTHRRLNGAYRDGVFELYGRVNVGVAVATEDGLVVPVVSDADRLTVTEIAERTRALAARARLGTVTPPELSGGTFTVSNLGMLGVDSFAGVINPPQSGILCVGAIRPRPAVSGDGEIAARPLATLSLVCDHRIVYGADAAAMLADLRDALEHPLRLLL
jgi:pyruvate dehydrogenase E2 component (dihydrolipoamide acetyltransferase)